MRIFLHSADVIHRIACEMFNIELGEFYYDNGVIVNRKTPYPQFELDGITTSIRSPYGILYADIEIKIIREALEKISAQYARQHGVYHLDLPFIIQSKSEQFTRLCSNNLLTSEAKRTFWQHGYNAEIISSLSIVSTSRFAWVILPLSDLLVSIERSIYQQDALNQLVSIVYDHANYFTFADNEFVSQEVTFKSTKIGKIYKDILYLGEVNDETLAKLKKLDDHESKSLSEIYDNYKHIPGFILSDTMTPSILILCKIRRGAFEIIRHLGKWDIYKSSILDCLDIHQIELPIYECTYHDICIDNTPYAHDICSCCDTPLYDDIYVIFPTRDHNIVRAVCPVCMHSTFVIEDGKYIATSKGQLLYNSTDTIARLKYPRKLEEILPQLPVDDLIRDILRASFNSMIVEIEPPYLAIYLYGEKTYIGWSGPISKFIMDHAREADSCMQQGSYTPDSSVLFSANILVPPAYL